MKPILKSQLLGGPFSILRVLLTIILTVSILGAFVSINMSDCGTVGRGSSAFQNMSHSSCELVSKLGGVAVLVAVLVGLFGFFLLSGRVF
jgi:hypothetical protein